MEKGDKLRLFHQIRLLSRTAEIHLVTLTEKRVSHIELEKLQPYVASCTVVKMKRWERILYLLYYGLKGLPFQIGWFTSMRYKKKLTEIIETVDPQVIYCQLFRMAYYCKDISVPAVIDYMDAFGEGMQRRGDISPFPVSLLYRWEANRIKDFEGRSYDWFKKHILISREDEKHLGKPLHAGYSIVSNGVDNEYFVNNPTLPKYEVGFVGNLGYLPNVEAAHYLIKEVLPGIPGIRISICGARPDKSLIQLHSERVDVIGWMEDIRHAYSQIKIFVAPIFKGTGQQNKILEAMALGIPCITTSAVNKAIGARDQEHLLIADHPDDFVVAIQRLLNDEALYSNIKNNARTFVVSNFTWENHVNSLEEILKSVTQ